MDLGSEDQVTMEVNAIDSPTPPGSPLTADEVVLPKSNRPSSRARTRTRSPSAQPTRRSRRRSRTGGAPPALHSAPNDATTVGTTSSALRNEIGGEDVESEDAMDEDGPAATSSGQTTTSRQPLTRSSASSGALSRDEERESEKDSQGKGADDEEVEELEEEEEEEVEELMEGVNNGGSGEESAEDDEEEEEEEEEEEDDDDDDEEGADEAEEEDVEDEEEEEEEEAAGVQIDATPKVDEDVTMVDGEASGSGARGQDDSNGADATQSNSNDASAAAAAGTSGEGGSAVPPPGPKKRGRRKKSEMPPKKSPSPPYIPPAPPPPLTVRLTIKLGGPSDYTFNIAELAKQTGQRHPTPPRFPMDILSDGGSDDDGEGKKKKKKTAERMEAETGPVGAIPGGAPLDGSAPVKKKRKKRQEADAVYDLNDPFIDDSDLYIDNPTHFAQTKQKGFYVNSGDVSLLLDDPEPTSRRGKRKAPVPDFLKKGTGSVNALLGKRGDATDADGQPTRPPLLHAGTRDSPIPIDAEDGDATRPPNSKRVKMENGQSVGRPPESPAVQVKREDSVGVERKRKLSVYANEAASSSGGLSPEMRDEFAHLETLIKQASFSVKHKFPPQLREPLANAAEKAIVLGEYGEAFFRYLPEVFPYNKFTMTKLAKRLVFTRHVAILNTRIDELIDELAEHVTSGFEEAKQSHDEDVARYEQKQAKKQQAKSSGAEPEEKDTLENEGDGAAGGDEPKRQREMGPPIQRYKFDEPMKELIWGLIQINNEVASMTNQMHEWEPENHPSVSDQSMRKSLYQKIIAVFPDGWMTSGLISREFSNMKKKAQQAENEVDLS